jgi:hypothetical protein
MGFAPPSTRFDVYFITKENQKIVVAENVDMLEAGHYAFHPKKPPGARFVCKRRI